MKISETDLILNPDGSAYHLNLFPDDIANTVILVGDQDRVAEVSKHFDHIELHKEKREFVTHTGYISNKRITVLSTGIGTDNIDIVLNELDALVNINLETREINDELRTLNLIRIGTSGIVQADIPVDSLLVSEAAFGLDPLMHYYINKINGEQQELLNAFTAVICGEIKYEPYFAAADVQLLATIGAGVQRGITITSPGFYAPQGRQVRAQSTTGQLMDIISKFNYKGKRVTNLEMETAGIYGMAAALGHRAISFNVLLANRITNVFSRQPLQIMNRHIEDILDRIAAV